MSKFVYPANWGTMTEAERVYIMRARHLDFPCEHWRWANADGLGPICQDCGEECEPPEGVRPMTREECRGRNERFQQ